jgi:hypothetical protein
MKSLYSALVKAQSEMSGAVKDSKNPFFKSNYADLVSVMQAIRPALANNGLGFIQVCHDADGAAKIETIIIHESGEQLSCGIASVPVSKNDAQAYGSAITYAKRYSLQAAFGVPSVDDDGNSAALAPPKQATEPSLWERLDDKTRADLAAIVNDVKNNLKNPAKAANVLISANLSETHRKAVWSQFTTEQQESLKPHFKKD